MRDNQCLTDDNVVDIMSRWPRPAPDKPKHQRRDRAAVASSIVRGCVEIFGWVMLAALFFTRI